MNPIASINKNLRELERAWSQNMKEETRERASMAVREVYGRMFPEPVVAVSSPVESVSVGGASVTLSGDLGGCGAFSTSSVGTTGVRMEWKDGVTTVYPAERPFVDQGEPGPGSCLPVVPEEYAVEGDVNGSSGTFYPDTVAGNAVDSVIVNDIGGWPEYAQIKVIGLFPNRRSLKGTLADGRTVHVERRMDWKLGEVRGRLVRAGAAPLYRSMPTQ